MFTKSKRMTMKVECDDCYTSHTIVSGLDSNNPWGTEDGLVLWDCPVCDHANSEYPPSD